jgi:hypothetical protein
MQDWRYAGFGTESRYQELFGSCSIRFDQVRPGSRLLSLETVHNPNPTHKTARLDRMCLRVQSAHPYDANKPVLKYLNFLRIVWASISRYISGPLGGRFLQSLFIVCM